MRAHILVVEDDATARVLLSDLLRFAGYRVTEMPDGQSALDALERDRFDVVLTDIIMGDVDGLEVLHTARIQPYRPAVILLTGHGTLNTCMAALRAGATDYLLKPCPDDALLACVERALQRYRDEQRLIEAADLIKNLYRPAEEPSAASPRRGNPGARVPTEQVLRVGALVCGASRQEVTLHSDPVHVTPIEYAILRCLAETPGTVRTFREIVQYTHALDMDDAEAQTLLKVHISNLRKKLSSAHFVNHRGIGYMLIDPESTR
jgi:DNA-binding response OmpR family regulator